jgi:DNA-binding response OmpR family regulator
VTSKGERGERPTVLIVDDDMMGTELLITLLRIEGFEAFQPENWHDPLHDIKMRRPNLVIIDVRLRSRSGFDLLSQIRAHPDAAVAGTPVIMMSAEDYTIQSKRAGADGFVSKPFDLPAMLDVVRSTKGG